MTKRVSLDHEDPVARRSMPASAVQKTHNGSMPRFWLSELFAPADSELATFSLSLGEFVARTGGMPSDVDKREQDRRARIQNIEEDDAVF